MLATQSVFTNLNLLAADSALQQGEYLWLINARQRFGYNEPILKHNDLTARLPLGKVQNITAVGNVLLAFVGGLAYFQEDGSSTWTRLQDFAMDGNADQYWTQSVPESNMNFVRKAATNINSPIVLTTDFKVSGTPQCVVVQDGINQPWLIIYDTVNQIFTARQSHNYSQWSNVSADLNDREYIPIGKQMAFIDGILFIVSPDGTKVFRSITGRPLDFMVIVDQFGNKLTDENQGKADNIAFAFDSDIITCLQATSIPQSFIYGTARNTRICTFDYTITLFGEPRFSVTTKLSSGVINQYAIVDILNDTASIDFDGVKSFNAVQQLRFRGRNSVFSLSISKLLKTNSTKRIKQTRSVCVNFDDYAIFNLDTRYGNIMCIYDTLSEKWVALDITVVSQIKQFAVVETLTTSKLYAITWEDELFQLFAGPTTETAMLRTKAYVAAEPMGEDVRYPLKTTSVEHKSDYIRLMFNSGTFDGKCIVLELVDDQISDPNGESKTLRGVTSGVKFPVRPPIRPNNDQQVDNPTFVLKDGLHGKKISCIVIWNNDAQLVEYEYMSSNTAENTAGSQKQQVYTNQE